MSTNHGGSEGPWTIGRLLAWTGEYLSRERIDDARLAAEVLLAHAMGCRRIDLYAGFERTPDPEQTNRFRELVRRAAQHEPTAYLVGEREFFSLPMRVTPDVLIPRPETETLVECIVDHCRAMDVKQPRILDVGTGSGCIMVAALVQTREATGVATDVSAAALAVARSNAERHRVADRLQFIMAAGLDLPVEITAGGFDVLVCNPPYIAAEKMSTLDPEVRDYEPRAALTDGDDGLSFYRLLGGEAAGLLRPQGVVLVEVGDGQADAARAAMVGAGKLAFRASRRDRSTRCERALCFDAVAVSGASR